LAVVFFQLNPLVSIGREHQDYDPAVNNLNDRYAILVDTLEAIGDKDQEDHELQNPNDNFHKHIDISGRYAWIERVRALGARFDVATIQGYLIKEYNEARPGETMKDILYILIPRILWPDKPIMTSHGNKLSVQFFKNEGMRTSSTAPTYTGEAYWNYGIVGVIVVSVYIGVIFGVLSFMGLHAVNNGNISYLLIAYPVLATAIFVESWIASTYVGGLVTVLVIYYLIRSVIIVLEKRCLNVSVCE